VLTKLITYGAYSCLVASLLLYSIEIHHYFSKGPVTWWDHAYPSAVVCLLCIALGVAAYWRSRQRRMLMVLAIALLLLVFAEPLRLGSI
jgi:hypothetical protein